MQNSKAKDDAEFSKKVSTLVRSGHSLPNAIKIASGVQKFADGGDADQQPEPQPSDMPKVYDDGAAALTPQQLAQENMWPGSLGADERESDDPEVREYGEYLGNLAQQHALACYYGETTAPCGNEPIQPPPPPVVPNHRIIVAAPVNNSVDDTVPEPDPSAAAAIERGATESGWRPAQYWENFKEGIGLAPDPDATPTKTPTSYADGGDVSPEDLAALHDMFGQNSSSLGDALTDSRQQALDSVFGGDAAPSLSDQLVDSLPSKSAADSAQVFFPEGPGVDPSMALVPTQSDAGFSLVGEPYGGSVVPYSGNAVSSAASSNLPAVVDNTYLPPLSGKSAYDSAQALQDVPLSNDFTPPVSPKSAADSAAVFEEADPLSSFQSGQLGDLIPDEPNSSPLTAPDTVPSDSPLGEILQDQSGSGESQILDDAHAPWYQEASELGLDGDAAGSSLGELASDASLPTAVITGLLSSTPAGAGEDDIVNQIRARQMAGSSGGSDSSANDPDKQTLFDMLSKKYQDLTPGMTGSSGSSDRAAPSVSSSTVSSQSQNKSSPWSLLASSGDSGDSKSSSSTTDPLLTQYLKDKQDMQNAQQIASDNRMDAGLASALGMIGAATYGSTRPYDAAAFQTLDQNANMPVVNLQMQQDAGMKGIQAQQALLQATALQQASDPNSTLSAQTRAIYAPILQKAGLPVSAIANMSANDIKSYEQGPLEFTQQQNAIQAQRALQLEMMKDRMQMMQGNRQNQYYNQTVQQLEQMRGNTAAKQAEKDIYAAQKANRLISQAPGGDVNNLSPQQVGLLVQDVAKINAGQAPSEQELNVLTPHTIQSQFANVVGNLTNNPTPANAAAFLKQYQNYANGVTQDAQNIITDRYGRIINAHANELTPEEVQTLRNNYINRFMGPPSVTSNGGAGAGSTVKVVSPTGNIHMIPASQLQAAIAAGGKVYQGQ